jgi:beta-galactosidase/beta-glucuronidase
VRVHAVVMDANFYSLCDQLGLMVWQADVGGMELDAKSWTRNSSTKICLVTV